LRNSTVDKLILDLITREENHISSQDIFEHLKPVLPAVNRSTIYRALDRLVKSGQVSVSDLGTGSMLYQHIGGEIHHHLVCQKCQKISTLSHDIVEKFFSDIQLSSHFKIATKHLILYGVCPNCQQSE
jgi:Fur family ferric uptake transcriptional regulator